MKNAIVSEIARPTTAPSRAPWVEVEKMIASVKTTVSRPSGPSDWKGRRVRPVGAVVSRSGFVRALARRAGAAGPGADAHTRRPRARPPPQQERCGGRRGGGEQVGGCLEDG